VLVYHVDQQSHWELLRTVVGPDPTNGYHVVAYPPDSDTPQEIWKSGDSPAVVSHTGTQLLMGPLDAMGPSVQSE
jgi:hypothetical protein